MLGIIRVAFNRRGAGNSTTKLDTKGTLLLIINEAHLLDSDTLTDLRLLTSSVMDAAPPLKILLVGQEALRSTLKPSCFYVLAVRNRYRT